MGGGHSKVSVGAVGGLEKKSKKSFSQESYNRNSDASLNSEVHQLNQLSLNQHMTPLMVVLYDFTEVMENQVSIKRGQIVRRLATNNVRDWSEVEYPIVMDNMSTYRRGWVPTSYLAPADSNMAQNPQLFINALASTGKTSLSAIETGLPSLPSPPSLYNHLAHYPWFHNAISRDTAEQLLKSGITGSYLVRCSESKPGELSVTVRNNGRVYHYRISQDSTNKYYITDARRFQSISQLIEHHCNYADGLVCPLQFPAKKLPSSSNLYPSVNSASSSVGNLGLENWEIDRMQIIMKHKLGSGQYGDVYQAWWNKYNTTVAVKTVKQSDSNVNMVEFLKEAALMCNLRHKNLIQLLGVCTHEPPFYLVTEFMPFGNMLLYLRNSLSTDLPPKTLLHMAVQIAAGMAYLEAHNVIHRDLAARNCLVGENHLIKVADFGLARTVHNSIYTAHNGAKFPIKWTAPEGLSQYIFSSK
ncbi:Tyrosine-protein kinase abl2 [Cichlidogyrus casuarinus]|uniref:Tyrosine-protein kinase n=1 Tax=Cichlidogyrus casuarinus TaxID=1844966 RepID=A0ABD2PKX1_9PLAT